MPALTFTDVGEGLILGQIVDYLNTVDLHLYTNDRTLECDDTDVDFTLAEEVESPEPTWGEAELLEDGSAVSSLTDPLEFTYTPANPLDVVTICGLVALDETDDTLIFASRLPCVELSSGDTVTVYQADIYSYDPTCTPGCPVGSEPP